MTAGATTTRPLRCGVYTRSDLSEGSSEGGDTSERQREICASFVLSQPQRPWGQVSTGYDDEGFCGGNLKRPALKRLLVDIERGLIDVVLVSRIDRLTRSLGDLDHLIRQFDEFSVTLVSVTQPFDSSDSTGRLILNVLGTFAAFQSQMASQRNRATRAAMKLSGRWPGGRVPLGYDLVEGRLVVNPVEAETVRKVYALFIELGSCKKVARALRHSQCRSKAWTGRDGKPRGGRKLEPAMIYWLVGRRLYLGDTSHGEEVYPGTHAPIVDQATFERAMLLREENSVPTATSRQRRSFLLGLLFDGLGRRMVVDQRTRDSAEYRFYASAACQPGDNQARVRAHAGDLEKLVLVGLGSFLRDRFKISGAVFRTGLYDPHIEALLDRGPAAAQRLEQLDRGTLREVLEKLLARVEVTYETVRILISCQGLLNLLGWDGVGLFRGRSGRRDAPQIHVLELEAKSVRVDGTFSLPILPRIEGEQYLPRPNLVSLIEFAKEVQASVHANRHLTLEQIALRFDRQVPFIARVLRINYLAPDIVLAILDGRQPEHLTRRDLLYTALPMEWSQQRALLGFAPAEDMPGADTEACFSESQDPQELEALVDAPSPSPHAGTALLLAGGGLRLSDPVQMGDGR